MSLLCEDAERVIQRRLVTALVVVPLLMCSAGCAYFPSAGSGGDVSVVASHSADVLLRADSTGLHRSVDSGVTWVQKGTRAIVPSALAIQSVPALSLGIFWERPVFYVIEQSGTVLRSDDAGVSWSAVQNPPGVHGVVALAAVPGKPAFLAVGEDDSLWTNDSGERGWQLLVARLDVTLRFLAVDPAVPEVLYGISDRGQSLRSRDGGSSWQAMGPIEAASPGAGEDVNALFVRRGGREGAAVHFGCACGGETAGNSTSIIYVLQAGSLYRSFDQGETWGSMATQGIQVGDIAAAALDPVNADIVYAVLREHGEVMRSLDGGKTWRQLDGG